MDKFKGKLTIASASQNLDTKGEKVVHRFIPMLVAESMNRIAEYRKGKYLPRIDLWNCIGMRMDKAFENQNKYTSRKEFSSALLEDKYALLGKFGISPEKRKIIRDDDESTKNWLNYKLNALKSAGIIYIELVDVDICNSCGYLKSISKMHTGGCTKCGSKNFHPEKRKMLMLDIPKSGVFLTDDRIVYPKKTKHIQGFFNQLPPRMMISKMRDYGLSLDSFDLPDYVLDPKIGVALMPELVAEMASLSEVTIVQGVTIAANTVPYSSILSPNLNHNYVLLPKIPKMVLGDAMNLGASFFGKYLPLILMEHNENMTATQFASVRQNYTRVMNKVNTIVSGLQSKEDSEIYLDSEEYQMVEEILKDFENYSVYEGRKKLNLFFKYQGRKYSGNVGDNLRILNSSDSKTLEGLVNLFYL